MILLSVTIRSLTYRKPQSGRGFIALWLFLTLKNEKLKTNACQSLNLDVTDSYFADCNLPLSVFKALQTLCNYFLLHMWDITSESDGPGTAAVGLLRRHHKIPSS